MAQYGVLPMTISEVYSMSLLSGPLRGPFFCAVTALASGASAASFSEFNTRVDALGNVVVDGTLGDLHYSIVSAPPGAARQIKSTTSTSGDPIGPWVGENSTSRWLGPNTGDLMGPMSSAPPSS
jgi:hypothetical protein